jgi:hypothetical protein
LKQNDNNFSVFLVLGYINFATKTFLSSSPGSQAATAESQAESQNLGLFCLLEVRLLEWSRQFEIMDSVACNAFLQLGKFCMYFVCQ